MEVCSCYFTKTMLTPGKKKKKKGALIYFLIEVPILPAVCRLTLASRLRHSPLANMNVALKNITDLAALFKDSSLPFSFSAGPTYTLQLSLFVLIDGVKKKTPGFLLLYSSPSRRQFDM